MPLFVRNVMKGSLRLEEAYILQHHFTALPHNSAYKIIFLPQDIKVDKTK